MDGRSLWSTDFEAVEFIGGLKGLLFAIVNDQYATIMMAFCPSSLWSW